MLIEEAKYNEFERKVNGETTILKTIEALQTASIELKILSMNIMEKEKRMIDNWKGVITAMGREKEKVERIQEGKQKESFM